MCSGTPQKKSIDHMLRQFCYAYDHDLILSYSYNSFNGRVVLELHPHTNIPVQTLARHIETCYPVARPVDVKTNEWGVALEIVLDQSHFTMAPPINIRWRKSMVGKL
jgi:hypothetical protein